MNLSMAHQRQSPWEESKGESAGRGVLIFENRLLLFMWIQALLNDLKVRHGGFPLLGATAEVSPV